jgi:hypothetical protein
MSTLKLPRSRRGWLALFWLSLRRCPVHHERLLKDPWFGDPGTVLYGFCCDGVSVWPRGLLRTLRANKGSADGATS